MLARIVVPSIAGILLVTNAAAQEPPSSLTNGERKEEMGTMPQSLTKWIVSGVPQKSRGRGYCSSGPDRYEYLWLISTDVGGIAPASVFVNSTAVDGTQTAYPRLVGTVAGDQLDLTGDAAPKGGRVSGTHVYQLKKTQTGFKGTLYYLSSEQRIPTKGDRKVDAPCMIVADVELTPIKK